MLEAHHRFALVLLRDDGSYVGAVAVNGDWEHAIDWARFHWQRRGELPLECAGNSASILPLWDHKLGEPYCRAYRVEIARPGRGSVTSDFPTTHFRELASAAASQFLKAGKLTEGETYRYVVVAHSLPPAVTTKKGRGLVITDASPALPVRDGPLGALLSRAIPCGVIDPDDMPIFIPGNVLREAAAQTLSNRGEETGGILIGVLWRDTAAPEIYAEITALIPAEHTSGNEVKLTFTAETWAAAGAVLRLRGRSECQLGFFHSHPVFLWCQSRNCTPESQKNCHLAKNFFSGDDRGVLRAAFSPPYSCALVANDTAYSDLSFSLFGYREGAIEPRGFYILEDKPHAT